MKGKRLLAIGWLCSVVAATAAFGGAPGAAAPQAPRARGAKVTFEQVRGGKAKHVQRARLLSLATERGETPTPFLPVGAYRATFQATVALPSRDRIQFRLAGRGKARLSVNGAVVLEGALRTGKPIETEKAVRLGKGDNDLTLEFESEARGDGQLRLFWSGTDFGFEPIAPELLVHAADDAALLAGEQLQRGHALFVERRCARCHEYDQLRVGESAYAELDQAGPDLRQVGGRVRADFLARWLHDPRKVRPDATMPRFGLDDAQCRDIAAWFAEQATAPAAPTFAAPMVAAGRTRFRELGCIACHAAPEESADDAALGGRIHLAHVKDKWFPGALVHYLEDPALHFPDVRMPNLKLSSDDASSLAAYLTSGATAAPGVGGDAKEGRRLVQKLGCYLCHELGDEIPQGDRIFRRFRNLDAKKGCLADEAGKGAAEGGAPMHGLSADDLAALRAFLPHGEEVPFRTAPMDYIERHIVANRCTACHAFDGEPSTWARWVERESLQAPLPKEQDPIAQGVPALTWVGAKLQPSWIEHFVKGELKSPRPWLTARMPAFQKHGATLAAGLVREHGYGAQDEPPDAANAQQAVFGERLVAQGTGFGCVQCHALAGKPAVQVFEREGIDLKVARGRLRHEYYTRWLADPTRLDPDSRMPKYADAKGKTAFTDVLGGDAPAQFEAIWQFLGSLR
ncbi:MAG: c-type cytochrome [Planctomycetota bacterium]